MSKTEDLPNGNTIYPWGRWESGRQFKVKAGVHFRISVSSFRNSLTAHAAKHGLQVTTRVKGDTVIFQFSTSG
ncbi:hypothetical protein NA78x_001787 [Anatilimnocola sp. NA78]|uniref:hypothetical protein n=1 Tax=Anatilimnocola sp. NA78 TaxID=3415683 RepID=UPI003CE49969